MMSEAPLIAGRYRVTGSLGRGSLTEVFKAEDITLGRKVAIKVLLTDRAANPRVAARFAEEARVATTLVHPHIGRVYDVGSARFPDAPDIERPYLVMERVAGLPLIRLLERGAIRPSEADRLMSEVLDGLAYAHRAGIVHRDLKPTNILINTDGSIRVVDFGMAAALTEASNETFHGDPDYAAPEARTGQPLDVRSDIYSAGVLFFHMLTGRVPLPGGYVGTRAVAASSINDRVPVALNVVVARALEPTPGSRFHSAGEFRAELSRADEDLAPISVPVQPTVSVAVEPTLSTRVDDSAITTSRVSMDDLPPTEAITHAPSSPSGPPTETDELVAIFGRNAVSSQKEFSPDLPEPARKRGRIALGLTVSVVFVVLVSFVTMWVLNIKPVDFFPTSARTVPNVVGFTYPKAVEAIKKAGMTPVRVDEPSKTVPKEAVIRTDPSADKSVDIGTRVTLYVSTGISQVQVPDVGGMSVDVATAELTKAGFKIGSTSQGNSAIVAKGLVLGTSPESAQLVQAGSTINLVLSNGLINIPDLTGKKIDEATSILSAEAIMLTPMLQADRTCKAGTDGITVSAQSIPPGDVPAGTPITLTYCAG